MDRMAAAELKDKWGKCRTRKCPFCDMEEVEDAIHVFWRCPAWHKVRAKFLPLLEKLGDKWTGRPLAPHAEWPKWVKSTGLIPSDPVLAKENLQLQEEEGEVRAMGGRDGGPRYCPQE